MNETIKDNLRKTEQLEKNKTLFKKKVKENVGKMKDTLKKYSVSSSNQNFN